MILPDGVTLLATVCNTLLNARPYILWFARKDEQYLVDLSDTLDQAGDSGLTGLTSIGDKLYAAVQSSEKARILVLDRRLNEALNRGKGYAGPSKDQAAEAQADYARGRWCRPCPRL